MASMHIYVPGKVVRMRHMSSRSLSPSYLPPDAPLLVKLRSSCRRPQIREPQKLRRNSKPSLADATTNHWVMAH